MNEVAADKLQSILSVKLGRELTDQELEKAYQKLMAFAFSLVDLAP